MSKINYKGFWTMLALMFGFTIFSASVMSGARVAQDLEIWKGALAIVIGNLILAGYGGVLAWISKKQNHNLDQVLRRSFGKKGAVVPSMIMVATQVGWFGVGIAMIAKPLSTAWGISPWVIVFAAAILMIGTAFFGIKSLTILSMIAVPLVLILGFTTMGIQVADGQYHETVSKANVTNTIQAVAVVIGTFISGATFVPNFAKEAKTKKIAWTTTALAFFVGNGLMITFGFVSQMFTNASIFSFIDIATGQGKVVVGLAYVILILNIWTTNDSGLFSISLGFENWFKLPKRWGVVIVGIIGAAASLWLFDHFIEFLSYMNRFVPGIGAIIIFNYLLVDETDKILLKPVNYTTICILLMATGATFISEFTPYAPFVAFGVAAGGYIFRFETFKERKYLNEKHL